MDIEKTSISFDEKIWMYKIDYWFYTKYFDCFILYYIEDGIRKVFWENTDNVFFDENFDLSNYAVWLTKFYDKTIVCLIDLDDFSTRYYIVKSCYFFDFTIKGKKYLFFFYIDEKWCDKLYHNCDLWDIEIVFDAKKFMDIRTKFEININNKVLGVSILYKIIYLNQNKINENIIENTYLNLSIADLFFFEDDFYALKLDLTLFELLNNKVFKVWNHYVKIIANKYEDDFFPRYRIGFYTDINYCNDINLNDMKKIFLCFFPKQYLTYIIDNKNINTQFNNYFLNVNTIDFEDIDLDFEVPSSIFEFDQDFTNFQINYNKLKYTYYNLKNTLNLINNNEIEWQENSFIQASKIRLSMNKQSLEIMINKYEEMLKAIIEKIRVIKG